MKSLLAILVFISSQALALSFTTEDYPPLNFATDEGASITGSSADIMNEVLKRSGLKATIRMYPWVRAYKMALVGKDVCVFSTTRTEEREKLFKWVGPLGNDSWVLFAKADSTISAKSLDDLKQYSIGGVQEDAQSVFLKANGFTVSEVIDDEQNMKKLATGRIDLCAASSGAGPWMARKLGMNLKTVLVFREISVYTACNPAVPDSDIAKMSDALKSIKSDGTYDKIMKTYQQ